VSLKLHKNRLWVGQVRSCLIHNNDRRFSSPSKATILILGPTTPPVQCRAGGLSTRNKKSRHEAVHWFHLRPRLRISEDMPQKFAKTELYFSLYIYILYYYDILNFLFMIAWQSLYIQWTEQTLSGLTQCCLAVLKISMGWMIRGMIISYINLSN